MFGQQPQQQSSPWPTPVPVGQGRVTSTFRDIVSAAPLRVHAKRTHERVEPSPVIPEDDDMGHAAKRLALMALGTAGASSSALHMPPPMPEPCLAHGGLGQGGPVLAGLPTHPEDADALCLSRPLTRRRGDGTMLVDRPALPVPGPGKRKTGRGVVLLHPSEDGDPTGPGPAPLPLPPHPGPAIGKVAIPTPGGHPIGLGTGRGVSFAFPLPPLDLSARVVGGQHSDGAYGSGGSGGGTGSSRSLGGRSEERGSSVRGVGGDPSRPHSPPPPAPPTCDPALANRLALRRGSRLALADALGEARGEGEVAVPAGQLRGLWPPHPSVPMGGGGGRGSEGSEDSWSGSDAEPMDSPRLRAWAEGTHHTTDTGYRMPGMPFSFSRPLGGAGVRDSDSDSEDEGMEGGAPSVVHPEAARALAVAAHPSRVLRPPTLPLPLLIRVVHNPWVDEGDAGNPRPVEPDAGPTLAIIPYAPNPLGQWVRAVGEEQDVAIDDL